MALAKSKNLPLNDEVLTIGILGEGDGEDEGGGFFSFLFSCQLEETKGMPNFFIILQ